MFRESNTKMLPGYTGHQKEVLYDDSIVPKQEPRKQIPGKPIVLIWQVMEATCQR